MTGTRPGILILVAGLLVSGVLAYVAVRNADAGATWDAFAAADLRWFAPSIALLAVGFFLRALRWWVLFDRNGRPSLWGVVKALFLGYLFNNTLPAHAGEAVRVVALNRMERTPVAEIVGTVLIERAYDVLSLVMLLFLMVPWLPHLDWVRAAGIVAAVLFLGLVVLALVLLRYGDRPLRFLVRPLSRLPFVSQATAERVPRDFVSGMIGLTRPRTAAAAYSLTTLSWIVVGLGYWIALRAFGISLSPLAGILVLVGIGLALILPSSPGALGVFEAAVVVVLGAYKVDASSALSYALALHVLNVLPFVLVAIPLALTRGPRARSRAVSSNGSAPVE